MHQPAHQERSDRFVRRNFVLNLSEGAFWIAGSTLIASQTVLPALVMRLGGGNVAVGAISVILWVGLFLPQIFAARIVQTLEWKKPWAIRCGATHRSLIMILGLIVLLLGATHPAIALLSFFVFFGMNQILMGIATPGWFDMYAKMTPIEFRGRLSGIRNSLAGACSFLTGLLLSWLFANFSFPTDYGIAIIAASTLQFVSLLNQLGLVEEFPSKVMPRLPMPEFSRQLRGIIRENAAFRAFIVSTLVLIVAAMPAGFFTVYALKRFSANETLLGQFTIIIMVGQIFGGVANGYLADHRGNKMALIVAATAMLISTVIAALAPTLEWFRIAFFFLGINLGTELMSRYNLAIEYGPVEQRSTYIGLMNTIIAPFYLAGILGGWISDIAGYGAVFVVGILFSAAGILLLITRVREPRHDTAPVVAPAGGG